jgi:hypothetical protein
MSVTPIPVVAPPPEWLALLAPLLPLSLGVTAVELSAESRKNRRISSESPTASQVGTGTGSFS